MCIFSRPKSPPPPPPLPPPPAPPAPPAPPVPAPEPLVTDVNPQVKRAKSKKDKNPLSKGTGALRIPLKNTVNTGTNTPSGGLNV
tara:strand:- start:333 stop:587 length:255 start_codon:yes stop_codon:yes gene_type:complete